MGCSNMCCSLVNCFCCCTEFFCAMIVSAYIAALCLAGVILESVSSHPDIAFYALSGCGFLSALLVFIGGFVRMGCLFVTSCIIFAGTMITEGYFTIKDVVDENKRIEDIADWILITRLGLWLMKMCALHLMFAFCVVGARDMKDKSDEESNRGGSNEHNSREDA